MIHSSNIPDQLRLKRALIRPLSLLSLSLSLLLLLSFCVLPVSAQAPVANFTANTTTGHQPLGVQFTDTSTGTPTGWAWYFGDEQFDGAWQEVNASSGWSKRFRHTSVVLPDGNIVLMGGNEGADPWFINDTWRSVDKGATWQLVNGSSGWSARDGHTSVVLPDGSIVLMGGSSSIKSNDTWRSVDQGATWQLVNGSSGWSAREGHSSVVLTDGSIVLMGGHAVSRMKDVWRSEDLGATWVQMTDNAQWSAREYPTSVALPDGSIVMMGGQDVSRTNDVWRSVDQGATWTQQTPAAEWSARWDQSGVLLPDGSLILMGGQDGSPKNDTWRSIDNGATWQLVNGSAGWLGRLRHSSVVLPDGSITLIGGYNSHNNYFNDTWRLETAGSAAQHPLHIYPDIGTFRVALQAFNNDGFNNKIVADYIMVTAVPTPAPTPSPSSDRAEESPVPTVSGVGAVSFLQGRTGQVLQNYEVSSPEGTAQVYLEIGTTALGPDGKAVGSITVEGIEPDDLPGIPGAPGDPDDPDMPDSPALPDGGAFMVAGTGHAVLCSPAGASFSPPVPLTFAFSPEEWEEVLADANGIIEALVIQWYDPKTGLWEEMQTI
ncbi:kelch repeat-containing protein, partial [Methanocalculus sp.]|uniref:kelch repeat-containing protein n=1 Tax=Methanocalculus sp. TaxID=2004547 RepID=UPI0026040B18